MLSGWEGCYAISSCPSQQDQPVMSLCLCERGQTTLSVSVKLPSDAAVWRKTKLKVQNEEQTRFSQSQKWKFFYFDTCLKIYYAKTKQQLKMLASGTLQERCKLTKVKRKWFNMKIKERKVPRWNTASSSSHPIAMLIKQEDMSHKET